MKTVLITGVSRGIGKALAQRFLENGDFVIGTSISGETDLKGENLTVVQLDLTQSLSIQKCAEQIESLGKKIDILINNAGILLDNDDTEVILSKLRGTLEVNLIGTIDFTERIIPLMSSAGHIVNISSSAGSLNGASDLRMSHYPYHYPAYKISKAALNMYTCTLANRFENEKSDILVSSVHPGWVKTDMGGEEAEIEPEEAAEYIFKVANSKVKTGQFWFKGEKFPW